jgi:hypothetical protein
MIEKYYGCFADGGCYYLGYYVFKSNDMIDYGVIDQLDYKISAHGPLIAKWTVRFKNKTNI